MWRGIQSFRGWGIKFRTVLTREAGAARRLPVRHFGKSSRPVLLLLASAASSLAPLVIYSASVRPRKAAASGHATSR
jgi:hypothetical protein